MAAKRSKPTSPTDARKSGFLDVPFERANLMEWIKEFETGHERLDLEHRIMFDLINQLQNMVKEGVQLENIEVVGRKIIQFAEHHFKWEEELMVEVKFPTPLGIGIFQKPPHACYPAYLSRA